MEPVKTLSSEEAAEVIRGLLQTHANGGKDESARILQLGEEHSLTWVPQALAKAQEARKEVSLDRARLDQALSPKPSILQKPKPVEPLKLRLWSEVRIPESASELERLTYVPGLVGDMTEWIVSGAVRPNRMMALGVALSVVGTLIGRRVMGPTKSATHLYIVIIMPSGYGKDWPLACGTKLIDAVAPKLLGPQEFASSPGFLEYLVQNPLTILFVDEMGEQLALIHSQSGNAFISMLTGTLKRCYNAWETVKTAAKVNVPPKTIIWPAVSIVGAATPEAFFNNLTTEDLESGFANRILVLPFEGFQRPPENPDIPESADVPPASLIAGLKKLYREPAFNSILDLSHKQMAGQEPLPLPNRDHISWGAGAKEIYYSFSRKMDAYEGTDRKRYELGMRACENSQRLATNIASGRGSRTVDVEDITWGIAFAEQSLDASIGGIDKYMHRFYKFPKFCQLIFDTISAANKHRFMTEVNVERKFGRNQLYGNELSRALQQLIKEARLEYCQGRQGDRGPETAGYRALVEEP